MSEAILYAIDAPQMADANAAAAFVEQWQDCSDAPTAPIASFFARLLQTWPEDGSKGLVWYEDFSHNRPLGPLLAMTFELSEFDDECLRQLRAIAKDHGVHVFDPEGHVLYLADGSEAASPSVVATARSGGVQSESGLRFDGVYLTPIDYNWSYLHFGADGQIYWQSLGSRRPVRAVMDLLLVPDGFAVKGTYSAEGSRFKARLKASFGAFKMEGVLMDDGLHVHSERENGEYPFDAVYTFVPLEPAKP